MPLFRPRQTRQWDEEDHRRVRSALAKLDPWSFWSVEVDPSIGAEYVTVGTTGAFAVTICGLRGYVEPAGEGLLVGDVPVSGFREVKRAAKTIKGRLSDASTFTKVDAIICLTHAIAGTSRTVRGVRVARLDDLPAEIAGRERTLEASTARRGAQALGPLIPRISGPLPDAEDE